MDLAEPSRRTVRCLWQVARHFKDRRRHSRFSFHIRVGTTPEPFIQLTSHEAMIATL